jgi:hypothetical protein
MSRKAAYHFFSGWLAFFRAACFFVDAGLRQHGGRGWEALSCMVLEVKVIYSNNACRGSLPLQQEKFSTKSASSG